MKKSIGIKLYNDKFYPILKSDENKIKKLELTTIRDNQEKAIIELYEGNNNKCVNNEYLGKLIININRNTNKGEPAFEVHLRKDDDGMIYAKAWDVESNEQNEIKIEHSNTIERTRLFQEPLSNNEMTQYSQSKKEVIGNYSSSDDKSDFIKKLILIGIIALACLILLFLIIIGIRNGVPLLTKQISVMKENTQIKKMEKARQEELKKLNLADQEDQTMEEEEKASQKDLEDEQKMKQKEEEQAIQKELEEQKKKQEEEEKARQKALEEQKKKQDEEKIISKPDKQGTEDSQQTDEKIIGMKSPEGETYQIKWGDNLWDICIKFYNDPWYYPELAKVNKLSSPRLIFAGKSLVIPPKKQLKRWEFVD